MNWTKEHWILLSLFLGGIASTVSGLGAWSDLLKPAVFSGFLMQLSAILRAFYSERPEPPAIKEAKADAKEAVKSQSWTP